MVSAKGDTLAVGIATRVRAWFLPRLNQNWWRVAGMTPIAVIAFRQQDSPLWLKYYAVLVLVAMALEKPRVHE